MFLHFPPISWYNDDRSYAAGRYFVKHIFSFILCVMLMLSLAVIAYASPVTGDNGIGMWIVLMVVAVIVLVGIIVMLLKKNKGPKE